MQRLGEKEAREKERRDRDEAERRLADERRLEEIRRAEEEQVHSGGSPLGGDGGLCPNMAFVPM